LRAGGHSHIQSFGEGARDQSTFWRIHSKVRCVWLTPSGSYGLIPSSFGLARVDVHRARYQRANARTRRDALQRVSDVLDHRR
jgi:hypothetical protein